MDQDTIAFLRELCKKMKEVAEISDRFLALQASKKEKHHHLHQDEKKPPQNRLIPLVQWTKHHDWPSISALRGYAFMRHKNGFEKVVSKVGKRLVIDEQKFFDWVRTNPKSKTNY